MYWGEIVETRMLIETKKEKDVESSVLKNFLSFISGYYLLVLKLSKP